MSLVSEVRQRAKQPWLIWSWLVLRIKKFFKVDFYMSKEMFDQEPIDIVIPTIQKDFKAVAKAVPAARANLCHPINKIFIVTQDTPEARDLCKALNCEFIDETSYLPVQKSSIKLSVGQWDRSGWIFQQLLKFGADAFVTTKNFLILESDTVFVNPVGFLQNGKFVFGLAEEWNPPYFVAFKKLFGFDIKCPLSFICHMMIFNKDLLAECKKDMEKQHNMPWHNAYLAAVDTTELSSIADYENYAHWVYCKHKDKVITKPFYNTGAGPKTLADWQVLQEKFGDKVNSVSFHSYIKD